MPRTTFGHGCCSEGIIREKELGVAIEREKGVRSAAVGELLDEVLYIPSYQRPFRWEPATAVQLLDDIREACKGPDDARVIGETRSVSSYVLGAVILHWDGDEQRLNVVDGQQRLLTLTILLDLLDDAHAGRDLDAAAAPGEDAKAPIVVVRQRLAARVRLLEQPGEIAAFIRGRCELIRIETNDPDEAFRVFDSQNYRGKALLPHDLLKAYHLREMRSETESMKAALVETWESVAEADLDRLFSAYLWRIRQWSRGLAAPAFAPRHVDVFKGITTRGATTPASKYHLAAQAAVPLLSAWSPQSDDTGREAARTRFQLDAPVQAGGSFFEMVTFMLSELKRLRREGYAGDGWETYASSDANFKEQSSKSQFRYVSELYLASLLYYTNKFGDGDVEEARRLLVRWAYSLRTELRRVQMVSINNHARELGDGKSAFVLIRNADVPAHLRKLDTEVMERDKDPGHMKDLLTFLNGLGG
ncbi:hypothetical protein C6I20_07805 [Aeromicrobium sp. A1-2]|nr:hypothetical protein C6I20_07805 [Aeromicrobium sp. A1-2]